MVTDRLICSQESTANGCCVCPYGNCHRRRVRKDSIIHQSSIAAQFCQDTAAGSRVAVVYGNIVVSKNNCNVDMMLSSRSVVAAHRYPHSRSKWEKLSWMICEEFAALIDHWHSMLFLQKTRLFPRKSMIIKSKKHTRMCAEEQKNPGYQLYTMVVRWLSGCNFRGSRWHHRRVHHWVEQLQSNTARAATAVIRWTCRRQISSCLADSIHRCRFQVTFVGEPGDDR